MSGTSEVYEFGRAWSQLSDDDERSHHVVLLVLQDMAMPHVLVAAGARAGWHEKRGRREIEFHDHGRALAWVHPDCFLPATLVRVGQPRRAEKTPTANIERLSRDDLHVDEMEVDGMRIA